jgi:hypothetical protein
MSDRTQQRPWPRKAGPVLDTREAELADLINDPIAVLLRRSDNITLNDVHAALRMGAGRSCADETCRRSG